MGARRNAKRLIEDPRLRDGVLVDSTLNCRRGEAEMRGGSGDRQKDIVAGQSEPRIGASRERWRSVRRGPDPQGRVPNGPGERFPFRDSFNVTCTPFVPTYELGGRGCSRIGTSLPTRSV